MILSDLVLIDNDGSLYIQLGIIWSRETLPAEYWITISFSRGAQKVRILTSKEKMVFFVKFTSFPIVQINPLTGKATGVTLNREDALKRLLLEA